MDSCPCGSGKEYDQCCAPLIQGVQEAGSAESLMRSRYSAYVHVEMDYIYNTTHKDQRGQFNRKESEAWARKTNWHSLEICRTESGGSDDQSGWVEFIARYRNKGKMGQHHEVAEFRKEEGTWYFYDGHAPEYRQVVRDGVKIGRNDPCPCGSGKKYKKCCG
ncbi:MAG: YchJ family protein [Desulfobacteraceae bacterium]|jgi:SEC-C motif domain protein